jgi:transposase
MQDNGKNKSWGLTKMPLKLEKLPNKASQLQNIIVSLSTENEFLHSETQKLTCHISTLFHSNEELTHSNEELTHSNEELTHSNEELTQENTHLKTQSQLLLQDIKALQEELTLLKKDKFGKSSEKVKKKISELEQSLEEKELGLGLKTSNDDLRNDNSQERKRKAKRKKIPDNIPRDDIIVDSPKSCPNCGGEDYRTFSEDVSEYLEYVPSSFKVIRQKRARCVCQSCETLFQAELPSLPIAKGKAGPGLLAHIMVQKYRNHLPLYRQSEIYEREGLEISRSTLASWVGQCARLLNPLSEEIKKYVFSASQIHGDDTPVRVLSDAVRKTKVGRIWTYVFDGSPCGDKSPRAACYFYSPDRKGIRPLEHLNNFQGVLHADAYAGYNKLYESKDDDLPGIFEASCWAHTRRKFYEITVSNDNARIAEEAVEQIGKIYDLESHVRGSDPPTRQDYRIKHSKVLVEDLFTSFKKVRKKLPEKSRTAKAIAYALNNEEALKRFITNGKIEIDNNAAERALRAVAVGRKNWRVPLVRNQPLRKEEMEAEAA